MPYNGTHATSQKNKEWKSSNAVFKFESSFEDSNLRTKFEVRSKQKPPRVGLVGHCQPQHALHCQSRCRWSLRPRFLFIPRRHGQSPQNTRQSSPTGGRNGQQDPPPPFGSISGTNTDSTHPRKMPWFDQPLGVPLIVIGHSAIQRHVATSDFVGVPEQCGPGPATPALPCSLHQVPTSHQRAASALHCTVVAMQSIR